MAKRRAKKAAPQKKAGKWKFPFTKQNYIIFAVGLGVILIGYGLMATGITDEPAVPDGKWNNPFAVIIAPILLVIGYLVIIPYGILKFYGNKSKSIEE